MPIEQNPYVPKAPGPLTMEMFEGMNTSTSRVGIPDEQVKWLDGFFPLDHHNLRTLYDVGATLYTAVGTTIVFFGFVNIGATPYAIIFQADGSVVAVNVNTAVVTTILAAGTIVVPSQLTIGLSQWGQQYAIIVANQANGYWLWDGLVTYAAGTIGPQVVLTSGGSGYVSNPNIGLVGGSGFGAVFTSSISNGSVVSVSISNPGSGYLATDTPTLTFIGGNQSGSGASITAGLAHHAGGSGGSISVTMVRVLSNEYDAYATLVAGGSGYSNFTKVVVTGGDNVYGAPLKITASVVAGAISSIQVTNGLYGNSIAPTVSITDNGYYFINSTTIVSGGSGYSNFPVLSVVDASGSIQSSPVLTPSVTGAGSSITSVSIVSGGQFGASVTPTIVITDTATSAAGTVTLMPYGVSGNAVETYSGHVWVANQNNYSWSAPGSASNFATSAGGGSAQSADSYLKIGYTRLIQSNGFLYLIADSSIDYISGVQTAGTPPTTTFTKQNADPTIGTPYPWSVILHGQDLLFSNSVGIYGVAGARPTKISAMLDGIWGTGNLNLSAAHATIFKREVWMTLTTFVNPLTGATVTEPFMWDGKRWFASPQNMNMIFIGSQELNSVFTAYGTDGTIVAPLFTTPSTNFTKVVESKLWAEPGGYLLNKATGRFWAIANYASIASPSIILSIDAVSADPNVAGSIVSTSAGYTIPGPSITGHWVTPPQAVGQQGILTGMTIKTNCADMTLISAMIDDKIVGYRG
jgi:hypothetical protein